MDVVLKLTEKEVNNILASLILSKVTMKQNVKDCLDTDRNVEAAFNCDTLVDFTRTYDSIEAKLSYLKEQKGETK